MEDTLAALKERIGKAETRVQRYEKSLETARSELADLHTAFRVISDIAGIAEANPAPSPAANISNRQSIIVGLLKDGRARAAAPVDLYNGYSQFSDENISIDTFRTTIWRMKDKNFKVDGITYVVRSEDGAYWRECEDDFAALAAELPKQPDFSDDDDSEVPF
jgi:hypothetical protein